ncbi:AlpA family phage regulatory protein [Caballeronia sp. LjRoot29]|uniref:helix-turn-helix transcriptional regulator n=1 Tax=Caballeronia sp. LjRoot29 TaxID=3342315 RepID=UPI003ECD4E8C
MPITASSAPRAYLPVDGFIRREQLLQIIPISASTLRRRVLDGTFPKPARMSKNAIAWEVTAVRRWIESCTAPQA